MYVFYGEYRVGLLNAFVYALKYCARFGFQHFYESRRLAAMKAKVVAANVV